MIRSAVVPLFLSALFGVGLLQSAPYYGVRIGKFRTHFHDVVGEVFAVDDRTIFIKGFSYDGAGPDAFFWAGSSARPDTSGIIIPNEKGSTDKLSPYKNKDLVLRLPAGKTLHDFKWLSVWCRKFRANFGDLTFPRNLETPRPAEIGSLSQLDHGVSSGHITMLDAQTFLVRDVTYDGEGPAAYWWVSRGPKQHPRGVRLLDETGSDQPLPRYTGKTVIVSLPDGKTFLDFDWLGIWCEEARVDFGSIRIPQNVKVPPSPRMLGLASEVRVQQHQRIRPATPKPNRPPQNKLNCEVLQDQLGFELRWIMDGDQVVMQLVAKIDRGDYMALGLSRDDTKSDMVKADAAVAWLDKNGRGHVVDYYLDSKEQCVGTRGSCPDIKYTGAKESLTLLNAAEINGFTMVTFKRPQVALDEKYDQHVYSDGPQGIVWAVGPLNNRGEVSYHKLRTAGNVFVDFARTPTWNCPAPDTSESSLSDTEKPSKPTRRQPAHTTLKPPVPLHTRQSSSEAWRVPPIVCPSDLMFRAQIGPTGGKKGYQAITGKVGWGIAWYMNGLMIPEITVQRGRTYTFIVEGGVDLENSAKHHPFYITDDPEGGHEFKEPDERRRERIFAGVGRNRRGQPTPTATGRLCEWKASDQKTPETYRTFEEFRQSLRLTCQPGQPATLRWRPDRNTPNTVYYQCYTHRFLGWKIHVVDSCDEVQQGQASAVNLKNVSYGQYVNDKQPQKPFGAVLDQGLLVVSKDPQDSNSFLVPVQNKFLLNGASKGAQSSPLISVSRTQTVERPQQYDSARSTLGSGGGSIYYQGGFVPVIFRNHTHRQRMPDPTTPPPGFNRPLPFRINDSVPFQGTFKPGEPDFSGFNLPKRVPLPSLYPYQSETRIYVKPFGERLSPVKTPPKPQKYSPPYVPQNEEEEEEQRSESPLPAYSPIPQEALFLRDRPDLNQEPNGQLDEKEPDIYAIYRPKPNLEDNEDKPKASDKPHPEPDFDDTQGQKDFKEPEPVVSTPSVQTEEPQSKKEEKVVPQSSQNVEVVIQSTEDKTQKPDADLNVPSDVISNDVQTVPPVIGNKENSNLNLSDDATSDNNTNYSILSHILTLIADDAQPPPPVTQISVVTSKTRVERSPHHHEDHSEESEKENHTKSSAIGFKPSILGWFLVTFIAMGV